MGHFIDGERIAFDTETTGLRPWHGDRPFAFSFANEEGETAYFEFPVDPFTRKVDYRADSKALHAIEDILADPKIVKIMHNRKFDQRMCESIGLSIEGETHDTMFLAHCCDSMEKTYQLKYLAHRYAGIDQSDEKELHKSTLKARRIGKKLGWKLAFDAQEKWDGTICYEAMVAADYWMPSAVSRMHPRIWGEDENYCEKYASLDAVRTMSLFLLYRELLDELDVRHIYENIEQPLFKVIYKVEGRGVCISPERLRKEMSDCRARSEREVAEVRKFAWQGFNIQSHPQLRTLLYDKLALPVLRRTEKTRLPSTDVDSLNDHKNSHPAIFHILKWRSATKAFGYFESYGRFMQPDPISIGLMSLHADFQQMGPSTGRMACRSPNLQQVTSIESSRSADPIDVRHVFLPRKGYVWLHIDYKGMEVRVYADCSQEPKMLQAIAEGREIHDEVCNKGWGGKDNPAGIQECIHVLGLDGSELGTNAQLQTLWNEWGVRDWRTLTDRNRQDFAADFLRRFDWDIVKAQASIGKKVTKNKAKMVFFAKIYGGGPSAVTDLLHIEFQEAVRFLNFYDEVYPEMVSYKKTLESYARRKGFIRTKWGRRLTIRPEAIYQCVNYIVQGSSADLLKTAMINCGRFLVSNQIDGHVIMPIHDELVFEIHRSEFTVKLVQDLCAVMENTDGNIGIPMPVEPSYTLKSWHDKYKIELPKPTQDKAA